MPAEIPVTNFSQNKQAERPSTLFQNSDGDLQQTTTAFSYAQAAKGRSPSVPSVLSAGKAASESAEMNGNGKGSSETTNTVGGSNKEPTKRAASEGRAPQSKNLKTSQEDPAAQSSGSKDDTKNIPEATKTNHPKDAAQETSQDTFQNTAKTESLSDKPAVAGQSQHNTSTPSSPDYGTTSTSTLLKEDDVFSTANASSDSTSDKQSQTSQNGNKTSEKVDDGKEQSTVSKWDEENSAPLRTLKEAAVPQINVWHLRSQNQAKSKTSTPNHPSKQLDSANGLGTSNGSIKAPDTSMESKKHESRKKTKTMSGMTEDRSSLGPVKDGNKPGLALEKAELGSVASPPPPGDSISWPTPDSAVGDARKKTQDRVEKSEKDSSHTPKTHGKEKWVPVPYVPTAVFNTPLPSARRGGRGGSRGGRESGSGGRNPVSTSNGPEKPTVSGTSNGLPAAANSSGRTPNNFESSHASTNTSKPKRASSAGPTTPREQRKPGESSVYERRKETDTAVPKATTINTSTVNASRRPSVVMAQRDSQNAQLPSNGQSIEPSWSSNIVESNTDVDKRLQYGSLEVDRQPRATGPDRRNEGSVRQTDLGKDFQSNGQPRERGEPRPDRGRGGFRGRGGGNHAFFGPNAPNSHGYPNGYPSQYQSGPASPSKSQSNHDRFGSQAQGSFQSTHHTPRHYRANSRSQSIPHANQYGRFPSGYHAAPPHLANLQTDLANEYGYLPIHQGAMSAMPFNSYGDQTSVFGMVNLQMNYYFSVENLCKDMYLRSHMDSQGFVFLDLLAQFNRIKQLTNDMELIRQACLHSQTVEYVHVDGIDRVRAREGWQQWVRKVEERDPSAQNEGPSLQSLSQYPQPFGHISSTEERQTVSPRSNVAVSTMDNAQYQPLNGIAPTFDPGLNTNESPRRDSLATKTPLSAAVSEFSPSARSTSLRNFSTPDHLAQGTSVFTDEQVENLRILLRRPLNSTASVNPPFHSSSSRTFSNGSIDGRSISDELSKFSERQIRPILNGDTTDSVESLSAQRPQSPFSVRSPVRHLENSVSPPVLWIKDRQNSVDPLKSIPNDCVDESYHDFRQDALKQREQSAIGKDHYNMQSLYQFWSHFLVRNFNARMYEEFHRLALVDADQRESNTGMRSLLRFYDESILSQKAISDDNVARDFIDLVKTESSRTERPVFAKLRAVWRNGAFNMRNRSKLTKFVDLDLKTELER